MQPVRATTSVNETTRLITNSTNNSIQDANQALKTLLQENFKDGNFLQYCLFSAIPAINAIVSNSQSNQNLSQMILELNNFKRTSYFYPETYSRVFCKFVAIVDKILQNFNIKLENNSRDNFNQVIAYASSTGIINNYVQNVDVKIEVSYRLEIILGAMNGTFGTDHHLLITYERVNLQGAYLIGANLQVARLEGADLQGANLKWADLKLADLRGANLQDVRLEKADFMQTIFSDDAIISIKFPKNILLGPSGYLDEIKKAVSTIDQKYTSLIDNLNNQIKQHQSTKQKALFNNFADITVVTEGDC
jgi:uncharacterized protein YjbI with pentapeptide repeats